MTSPHTQRKKTNPAELMMRITSAVVLVVAALLSAYIGGIVFSVFWTCAAIAIFWEWVRLCGINSRISNLVLVLYATVVFVSLAGVTHLSSAVDLLLVGIVALSAIVLMIVARSKRDIIWLSCGLFYSTVIALFPPLLRQIPQHGLSSILWVFAVVWATDIAAYFVGRALGGPKLWPRVSPNKTWSGFCGGLIAGTLAGVGTVVLTQTGNGYFPLTIVALLSAIASILSQGGDLAESALKRHFGAKDSSSLIPGHGGVMDRLDGFWAAVFFLGLCIFLAHLVDSGAV